LVYCQCEPDVRERVNPNLLSCNTSYQKKSPEVHQRSPGTGVSVRTTYCSEERDGKHEKRSEERPVKPESDELSEFLRLPGSDHIPMPILPKLKPIKTQLTVTLKYNFKKRQGQKNG